MAKSGAELAAYPHPGFRFPLNPGYGFCASIIVLASHKDLRGLLFPSSKK
jgi:hypothetical protein